MADDQSDKSWLAVNDLGNTATKIYLEGPPDLGRVSCEHP